MQRFSELNPAEQICNILRCNYFANRVFDVLDTALMQAEFALAAMAVITTAIKYSHIDSSVIYSMHGKD